MSFKYYCLSLFFVSLIACNNSSSVNEDVQVASVTRKLDLKNPNPNEEAKKIKAALDTLNPEVYESLIRLIDKEEITKLEKDFVENYDLKRRIPENFTLNLPIDTLFANYLAEYYSFYVERRTRTHKDDIVKASYYKKEVFLKLLEDDNVSGLKIFHAKYPNDSLVLKEFNGRINELNLSEEVKALYSKRIKDVIDNDLNKFTTFIWAAKEIENPTENQPKFIEIKDDASFNRVSDFAKLCPPCN